VELERGWAGGRDGKGGFGGEDIRGDKKMGGWWRVVYMAFGIADNGDSLGSHHVFGH